MPTGHSKVTRARRAAVSALLGLAPTMTYTRPSQARTLSSCPPAGPHLSLPAPQPLQVPDPRPPPVPHSPTPPLPQAEVLVHARVEGVCNQCGYIHQISSTDADRSPQTRRSPLGRAWRGVSSDLPPPIQKAAATALAPPGSSLCPACCSVALRGVLSRGDGELGSRGDRPQPGKLVPGAGSRRPLAATVSPASLLAPPELGTPRI